MTSAAIRMPVSGSGAIAKGRLFGRQFMVMQMSVFPKCYSCRDLHHLAFRRFNNITRSSRPDKKNIGSSLPRTKPPHTHDLIISILPGRGGSLHARPEACFRSEERRVGKACRERWSM